MITLYVPVRPLGRVNILVSALCFPLLRPSHNSFWISKILFYFILQPGIILVWIKNTFWTRKRPGRNLCFGVMSKKFGFLFGSIHTAKQVTFQWLILFTKGQSATEWNTVCIVSNSPLYIYTTFKFTIIIVIIIIIIITIIIIIIEFLTSQLWLGNIHLSWDVVINRIRLGGLVCSLKVSCNWTCAKNYRFLQLYVCIGVQVVLLDCVIVTLELLP